MRKTGGARKLPPMSPLDIVAQFEQRSVNAVSFDWECVLERGYRRFLTPQSCVLDVGGHTGRHAGIFADAIGCRQITIFEPLPRERQYLEHQVDRFYWDYYLVPHARAADFQAQLWDEVYRALETSCTK